MCIGMTTSQFTLITKVWLTSCFAFSDAYVSSQSTAASYIEKEIIIHLIEFKTVNNRHYKPSPSHVCGWYDIIIVSFLISEASAKARTISPYAKAKIICDCGWGVYIEPGAALGNGAACELIVISLLFIDIGQPCLFPHFVLIFMTMCVVR